MSTGASPYVAALRRRIGTDLLLLPSAGMAVFDGEGRLLLVRHVESNRWAMPGGLVEPGEHPRDAAMRELLEETGLRAAGCELFGAYGGPAYSVTYRNGDEVAFVSTMYGCRRAVGELRLQADELNDARWVNERDATDLLLPDWMRPIVPDAFSWWRRGRRTDGAIR